MKSLLLRTALTLSLLFPLGAWSQVSPYISVAPPPLPVYAQPIVPGEGYIWTPGYWVWNPPQGDYYWVPGTWVLAPSAGELWTPGYWAFDNAGYFWYTGYWGSQVGFYGGLNYGYGYSGSGYQGGRWDHGTFQYNRAASNVGTHVVQSIYSTSVVNAARATRVSFNGGNAGSTARPTDAERRFQSAAHAGPSAEQMQHERTALTIPAQRDAAAGRAAPGMASRQAPPAAVPMQARQARAEPESRPQQQAHVEPPPQRTPQQQAPSERGEPEQSRQEGTHRER